MLRRSLIRSGELDVGDDVNILQSLKNHKCSAYIEELLQLGRFYFQQFNSYFCVEKEQLLRDGKNGKILQRGFWKEYLSNVFSKAKEYHVIHDVFLAFLAAFATAYDLTESCNVTLRERIQKFAKQMPHYKQVTYNQQWYYVFLGGLLNSKAHLFFEILLPLSRQFNINELRFAAILWEIEDVHSFCSSFEKMLPDFTPFIFYVNRKYFLNTFTTEEKFFLSPSYSHVFREAAHSGVIRRFLWKPGSKIYFKDSLTVEHLLIYINHEDCTDNLAEQCALLNCRRLTLEILPGVNDDSFSNFVKSVSHINAAEVDIILDCYCSSLLLCFHEELTQGSWIEKKIDRLYVNLPVGEGGEKCLEILADLVKKEKITKGINFCYSSDFRTHMKRNALLKELIQSVDDSKTIDELGVRVFGNEQESKKNDKLYISGGAAKKPYRSLDLSECFSSVQCNTVSVKEVTIIHDEWKDKSKVVSLIHNLEGIQYFCCLSDLFPRMKANGRIRLPRFLHFNELEELQVCWVTEDRFLSILRFSKQLPHLQVLTLSFSVYSESLSFEFKRNLTQLLSTLNLRIFEMLDMSLNGKMLDEVVGCVKTGLIRRLARSRTGFSGEVFLLQELLLGRFPNFSTQEVIADDNVWVKEIKYLLKKRILGRCSWLAETYTLERLYDAFPSKIGFRRTCEVDGMNPDSSRRSQHDYRWLRNRPKSKLSVSLVNH